MKLVIYVDHISRISGTHLVCLSSNRGIDPGRNAVATLLKARASTAAFDHDMKLAAISVTII